MVDSFLTLLTFFGKYVFPLLTMHGVFICDVGSAVVLVVTLITAVDTGDAIFVWVVTCELVCRVVWFLRWSRILLARLPGFLVVVVRFLECVWLAEISLRPEIRADCINILFLHYFQNLLFRLHGLVLHTSNVVCFFWSSRIFQVDGQLDVHRECVLE